MANKTSTFTNNLPPAVDATWYNINQTEMNNLITGSGLTVDNTGAINTQQQQSASRFAANNFYIDSGTADAYILTLAASFTNPVSATIAYFTGMTIRFRAGNAGTGGAAIVNVNGAGVKSLKEADGTTNPISIPTTEDTEWRYDGTVFRKVIFSTIGFRATLSANQVLGTGIQTKINLNTTSYNYGSYFNTSTSRFTPLVAGKYLFGFGAEGKDAGVSAQGLFVFLFLNGSTTKEINVPYYDNGNAKIGNTFVVPMNGSTDYIELYATISGTGATTIGGGTNDTYLWGIRISA